MAFDPAASSRLAVEAPIDSGIAMPDARHSRIIADVLNRFSETKSVTQLTHPTPGFSGAIIVRVQSPSGSFCLRGWPPNSLPATRILGLHRLLAHIHAQSVDYVAVPVASIEGDTLLQRHGRYWQLEPWLPGTADFWKNPNHHRLRSSAHRLVRWHQAAKSFQPRTAESEWFACHTQTASPAVHERLKRLQQVRRHGVKQIQSRLPQTSHTEFDQMAQLILKLFLLAADRVEGELTVASRQRFNLQPCLRDVWHDHLLFTGDDVTGLIDANACRRENVATDLARLFGSLIEDDRSAWDVALNEYQRHSSLVHDELALLQVFDRSTVLLAGMTWLHRAYIEQQPIMQDTRVIARLKTITRRLERLS